MKTIRQYTAILLIMITTLLSLSSFQLINNNPTNYHKPFDGCNVININRKMDFQTVTKILINEGYVFDVYSYKKQFLQIRNDNYIFAVKVHDNRVYITGSYKVKKKRYNEIIYKPEPLKNNQDNNNNDLQPFTTMNELANKLGQRLTYIKN